MTQERAFWVRKV